MRALVLSMAWPFMLAVCTRQPENVTRLNPPLAEAEVERIREEAEDRNVELEVGDSVGPTPSKVRIWSIGPSSLSYSALGSYERPLTVPLGDVSRLTLTWGRGMATWHGALDGARDGAAQNLFQEAVCAGSFRPECRADYPEALRSGAFVGAVTGLLFGLVGGDREPRVYTFSRERR